LVDGGGVHGEGVPVVIEGNAELSGSGGFRLGGLGQRTNFFKALNDLFGGLVVQSLNDPVVGKNGEFGGGKEDGEKPVVFFLAGVVRIGSPAFGSGAGGRGGSMVAVGDIRHGEFGEGIDIGLRIGDRPDSVSDVIRGDEVVEGALVEVRFNKGGERGLVAVGEEDGASVGVQGLDMAGAVVFFVGPGFFVLENDIVGVVVDVAATDDAGLGLAISNLAIEVKAGLVFADEGAVAEELVEVFPGFGINGVGVGAGACGEIDFGPDDVEEGMGVSLGQGAGFLGIDHIVGNRGDAGGEVFRGTNGGKGFDAQHGVKVSGHYGSRGRKKAVFSIGEEISGWDR